MRGPAVLATALAAIILVGFTGCNGEGELAADEVDETYAPELDVDLDRMERGEGGLYIEDVREGTGEVAEPGMLVLVHYTGWLSDGTKFDSSHDRDQPFSVVIGEGNVIPGWDEGIPGMREGGMRRLVIPYGMAYGASGRGPIPPRATLVFDVELLAVQ